MTTAAELVGCAPTLETRGATRQFGGAAGIRDLDLTVRPGEIHALIGLNGAGKSTALRLVLGMLRPTRGRVTRAPGDLGQLTDHPFAYRELTSRANLVLAARLQGVSRSQAYAMADAALEEFALTRYAGVRAGRLSLGNRQKLGLAAALQHHPALIVLDEPTNALDPRAVILLREVLLRRARAESAAVLVSSHHLDEVARIADRVTVINGGRVIGALDPHGADLERRFFALVYADAENAEES